jgi:hypothetical protein
LKDYLTYDWIQSRGGSLNFDPVYLNENFEMRLVIDNVVYKKLSHVVSTEEKKEEKKETKEGGDEKKEVKKIERIKKVEEKKDEKKDEIKEEEKKVEKRILRPSIVKKN